jgi:hypothetical protein
MAIEIIPKPESRSQEKGKILFIISLIVLASVASCYFYLFLTSQKKSEELATKQDELEQMKTSEKFTEKEKSILDVKKKIDDFNDLFKAHNSILGFFDFLEKNTHINVMWENANFFKSTEDKDSGSYKLSFSGNTDSFITLAKQIIVFRNRPEILSMKLTEISMKEKGKVGFGFDIIFSPSLFIFK